MGGERETFTDGVTVFGEVAPLSGNEKFDTQKVFADATTRVKIRSSTDVRLIERKDRIKFVRFGVTRTLDILHVQDPQERGSHIILTCRERPN